MITNGTHTWVSTNIQHTFKFTMWTNYCHTMSIKNIGNFKLGWTRRTCIVIDSHDSSHQSWITKRSLNYRPTQASGSITTNITNIRKSSNTQNKWRTTKWTSHTRTSLYWEIMGSKGTTTIRTSVINYGHVIMVNSAIQADKQSNCRKQLSQSSSVCEVNSMWNSVPHLWHLKSRHPCVAGIAFSFIFHSRPHPQQIMWYFFIEYLPMWIKNLGLPIDTPRLINHYSRNLNTLKPSRTCFTLLFIISKG